MDFTCFYNCIVFCTLVLSRMALSTLSPAKLLPVDEYNESDQQHKQGIPYSLFSPSSKSRQPDSRLNSENVESSPKPENSFSFPDNYSQQLNLLWLKKHGTRGKQFFPEPNL